MALLIKTTLGPPWKRHEAPSNASGHEIVQSDFVKGVIEGKCPQTIMLIWGRRQPWEVLGAASFRKPQESFGR